MLLANLKMSDKLQFVVAFGRGRLAETRDKLKFVGQIQRISPYSRIRQQCQARVRANQADSVFAMAGICSPEVQHKRR